jgi:hypothetical protein
MKANVTARPIPCARNSSRLLPLPTLLIMFIYFSFLFERERLNGMLSCRLVVRFVRIETSALGLRSLSLSAAIMHSSSAQFLPIWNLNECLSLSIVSVVLRQNREFPTVASWTVSHRIHSLEWIARVHTHRK